MLFMQFISSGYAQKARNLCLYLQDLRRKEVEAQTPYDREDRALSFSLGVLAQATRGARTALWSALQGTTHMEVDQELALGHKEPKVNRKCNSEARMRIMWIWI